MKIATVFYVGLLLLRVCAAAVRVPTNAEIDALFRPNATLFEVRDAVYPCCRELFFAGDRADSRELLRAESRLMTNIMQVVSNHTLADEYGPLIYPVGDLFGFVSRLQLLSNDPTALYYCADHIASFLPVSTNAMDKELREAREKDNPDRYLPRVLKGKGSLRRPGSVSFFMPVMTNIHATVAKWQRIRHENICRDDVRRNFMISMADPVSRYAEKLTSDNEKNHFRSNLIERAKLNDKECQILFRKR